MIKASNTLAIIPAHNERESIESVISEIRSIQPTVDILVVNDASTDGTGEIARKMGVPVADLIFNLGIGGAVQTGFKVARDLGYDIVVQIDGDGQHDARSMKDVLTPIVANQADIVIGSRYLQNANVPAAFTRFMGIRFFSWLTSRAISQRVTDCTSGFRALNKKAYTVFSEHYPVDFPDAEAIISAHRAGLRISEVPAKFRPRNTGTSSLRSIRMIYYPFKETLSILTMLSRRKRITK